MASDTDLLDQIRSAPDLGALDQLRVSALGKSGTITAQLKSLGSMDPDARAAEAPRIHAFRELVTAAIAERKSALESAELDRKLATETIDLSLPVPETPSGTVHPVSQVMDELAEIFADLGFSVAEGPEIEDQWHNFTALNMPEFHPARAMQDTFYLERLEGETEPRVLRTHTSPVQIRAMQANGAPLYVIAPGRVYRSDSDATHTPLFHQV
jgi:phenylalanyl-tRNA synthetase alpha chain